MSFKMKKLGTVFTVLIALIALSIGLYSMYHGTKILIYAKKSKSWPSIQGVVTDSHVTSDKSGNGGSLYSPNVKYKYTVIGKTYMNDLISFASKSGDLTYAKGIVEKYMPGKSVIVYFEPNDPQFSVLVPGKGTDIPLQLGIAFFFVGVFLILVAKKQNMKNTA